MFLVSCKSISEIVAKQIKDAMVYSTTSIQLIFIAKVLRTVFLPPMGENKENTE